MTDTNRPVCDCPEPCAGCGCHPCRIKQTALKMALLSSSSAALEVHDHWN